MINKPTVKEQRESYEAKEKRIKAERESLINKTKKEIKEGKQTTLR